MEELISVIIPAYNREETIISCVESVRKQSYNNIEIIIVDDGSTDETWKLFVNYPDKRVKYYKYNENKGACYARNYGVSLSSGLYIAFQDSDDIWFQNKLELEIDSLKKRQCDFIFCGMRRIYNESEYYYPMHFFNEDGDILEQVLVDNPASTQTMLMKRKIFDKVTFDVSFKRFQDWDFMLQIVLNGFKVSYLPQPLVKSTVQTNSISGTAKTCEAYEHLFKKYKEYYEMYPNALANIYMQIARSYRGIDKEKVKRNLYLSFKNRKAPKTLIKILLSYVGLWA